MRTALRFAAIAALLPVVACKAAQTVDCPPAPAAGAGVKLVSVGGLVEGVAVGEGGVWVLSSSKGIRSLVRLDPRTARPAGKGLDVGGRPAFISVGEGAVWVARQSGQLLKIDPRTRLIVQQTSVGHDVVDVSAGLGGVWVADGTTNTVSRIDPETGHNTVVASIPFKPSTLEASEGAVWVSGDGPGVSMARVDARTGRVTNTYSGLYLEAVGSGSVWVDGPGAPNGAIRRLDPKTGHLAPQVYPTPILPVSIAASAEQVWIATWVYYCKYHNPPEGPPIVAWEVGRIDPISLRPVSPFTPLGPTAGPPGELSIGYGALWTPGLTGLIRADVI
jgi:streptogramin lyase